jgi:hypothetical protein
LLHNNHWRIVRADGSYWLIPPPDIDPEQTPKPLVSKSAALSDLQRHRDRALETAIELARTGQLFDHGGHERFGMLEVR